MPTNIESLAGSLSERCQGPREQTSRHRNPRSPRQHSAANDLYRVFLVTFSLIVASFITASGWLDNAFTNIAFGDESKNSSGGTYSSSVGMTQHIDELVVAGKEVEVKPITHATSVVVRIIDHSPHGSNRRYNIEFYGLDPGTYNLIDFLQRVDGSSLSDVAAVTIEITAQLPAGQVEPTEPTQKKLSGMGGYSTEMIIWAVAWTIGLLAILLIRRGLQPNSETNDRRRETLADRLRPMIDQAIQGELSNTQLAELELTLIAFWRKRLSLDDEQAASVIGQLRDHDEAGPLLTQLETWLHNPNPSTEIDVAELLRPYQELSPDELESTA
jgi:hypothetical protein